ncbi:hypothetical protein AALP_AA8G231100 [Arabis alpina]|uniref:Uncharacterized protein n=1 Tax=Arabis alpina TaxID=50452 RepID=A0A087G8V8_ARAAL|nr:hypothetical protein AALP_AA8G231100 [Arabis alpina]
MERCPSSMESFFVRGGFVSFDLFGNPSCFNPRFRWFQASSPVVVSALRTALTPHECRLCRLLRFVVIVIVYDFEFSCGLMCCGHTTLVVSLPRVYLAAGASLS